MKGWITVGVIQEMIKGIALPKMIKVRQKFYAPKVDDVSETLRQEFNKIGVGDRIKAGMRVAIAVGSRGVCNIPVITRVTVEEIKKRGGFPFVVPGMGSHGGATAEGQRQVLKDLGVTEASVGCPIISSMEVAEVGKLENGLPVLIDNNAYEADGIVVINRVKPHTIFRGPSESGLVKMLSIGLGKQKGADSCHRYGFGHMPEHIIKMAEIKIARAKVLFGIATVENAYDEIAKIVAVPAGEIVKADQQLLVEAKERMPRIMFDPIDVLIVEEMGKEISGEGMDPNITGRWLLPYGSGGPKTTKLVILDLTQQSHGNAIGMGSADYTTRKFFNKIDYDATYANCVTSTITPPGRIPIILNDDREAITVAVKCSEAIDRSKIRVVRIKNTLHLSEIYISEALLSEAKANKDVEIIGTPADMKFDELGNLIGF